MAKRGRRIGAKTRRRTTTVHFLPVCEHCGSTSRTVYENQKVEERSGVMRGNAYTHVVHRECSCANCGTRRKELFFENRVGPIAIRTVKKAYVEIDAA